MILKSMIKRYRYLISITLIIVFFLTLKNDDLTDAINSPDAPPSRKNAQINQVDFEKLEINGKKVMGLTPGREKEQLEKLKVANTPSQNWKRGLEQSLLAQGRGSLQDLKLNNVDSFVWIHDGIALFVETVIVSLKNDQNAEISFKVLVDSQNGKILRNWDQPVIDPIDPRNNFKIKLDPRFHND